MLRDTLYSLRTLVKSPLFTLIAVLILTVAIGSVLAAFSIVDALFLQPLHVEHPEQLVKISLVAKNGHLLELPSTGLDVLQRDPTLHRVCGFDESISGVEIDGAVTPMGVSGYTGDCFETLGLHVQIGRGIAPSDNALGAPGIAVITDSLWHSAYAGRSDVLGKLLKIGTQVYTIVGVTGQRFRGLTLGSAEDVMIPLLQRRELLPNGTPETWYWVSILARRAPGVYRRRQRAPASWLVRRNSYNRPFRTITTQQTAMTIWHAGFQWNPAELASTFFFGGVSASPFIPFSASRSRSW